MASKSFYEICMEAYECIVCLQEMEPPIRHCVNGHSYCNKCCPRLLHCPLCRAAHRPKNHINLMDKFYQYLPYLCKVCDELCFDSAVSLHKHNCPKLWTLCPFSKFDYCTWYGPDVTSASDSLTASNAERLFKTHLREVHNYRFCREPIWAEIYPKIFSFKLSQCYNFVISAHNELFACNVKVRNFFHKKLWISVYHAGNERECRNYSCKVDIQEPLSRYCRSGKTLTVNCGSANQYVRDNEGGKHVFMYCIDMDIGTLCSGFEAAVVIEILKNNMDS